MISVVLADDHGLVRQHVRALLEAEPDIWVAAEAGTAPQAVSLVELLRPDVLVLDLIMGGRSSLEAMRQALEQSPRTGVVVMSFQHHAAYVAEALRAGARSYVPKDTLADDLVPAVHQAVSMPGAGGIASLMNG